MALPDYFNVFGALTIFSSVDSDAEPPTAEFCEATGVFDYPPDIYVKCTSLQQHPLVSAKCGTPLVVL